MLSTYMRDGAAEPLVYTVEEAARIIKVSRNYLYTLIKKKKGPPVKRLGNRIRIYESALKTWLNNPSK